MHFLASVAGAWVRLALPGIEGDPEWLRREGEAPDMAGEEWDPDGEGEFRRRFPRIASMYRDIQEG